LHFDTVLTVYFVLQCNKNLEIFKKKLEISERFVLRGPDGKFLTRVGARAISQSDLRM